MGGLNSKFNSETQDAFPIKETEESVKRIYRIPVRFAVVNKVRVAKGCRIHIDDDGPVVVEYRQNGIIGNDKITVLEKRGRGYLINGGIIYIEFAPSNEARFRGVCDQRSDIKRI